MENRDETLKDSETVLLALDQISQTIDVMTSVIGRLRTHVQGQKCARTGFCTERSPAL